MRASAVESIKTREKRTNIYKSIYLSISSSFPRILYSRHRHGRLSTDGIDI